MNQKFCNILVVCTGFCGLHHVIKSVLWKVPTIFDSIRIASSQKNDALLHSMCDLKTAQMNVQCHLFWKLIFHKFKLGHNIREAIKGVLDYNTVIRQFKKFSSSCQNFDDQIKSHRPKRGDFLAVLQTIKVNLVSSTQKAQHLTV